MFYPSSPSIKIGRSANGAKIKGRCSLMTCILVVLLMGVFASFQRASAAAAVLFCNGSMADPADVTTAQINGYRASGMNTMVIFVMSVQPNGDFTWGPYTVCTNGTYTGPALNTLLTACLAAPSSLNRIEVCFGGASNGSFTNIKNIIAAQGNNTGDILWKNLIALRNAAPIAAIDFDDESTYDSASAVIFGGMAGSMGFKVTLCPYTNPGYWQAVKSGLGSYCDRVYLQCYDGGAGNSPSTWDGYFGGGFHVTPGYWDADSAFLANMQSWSQSQASAGGFFYPSHNSASSAELLQYAGYIHQAMDIPQGVYYIQNVGNTGIALQGTGDPYLNGSGQYVSGCNEVAVTPYNQNANEQWSILPIGGGQYHIDNTSSHQWLQATGDPYHPHGGSNVAGCDKVALTPASGNSQQVWLIAQPQPGGGWTIGSPANSQYLHATGDAYWSNSTQSYVANCYQTAGVPYSWGLSTVREWYITWYRN